MPPRLRSVWLLRAGAAVVLCILVAGLALAFAGPAHWVPWLLFGLLGASGAGALVLIARLTDRDARLERRRVELAAILHATDDGICLADPEGRLIFANAAMERLWRELGLPLDGTIWDRLGALALQTDRAEELIGAFARLAEEPDIEIVEEAEIRSVGRSFVGRTVPVLDASGRLRGRVFTLRETTAEREADRLKDELIATVSHELRTPLTSTIGFLDIVLEGHGGELSHEQRRFLTIAKASSERLVRLVGDLLFTAKVEAGTLTIEPGLVELEAIVASSVGEARAGALEAGVSLRVEVDGAPAFWGDADRLRQLLDNVIANAVKFTPAGGAVAVTTRADDERAVIEVSDSGIGIPPDEVARLFERFFRASTAVSRHVPGTGLGLRICKAIVDAHGGTIDVESEEGRGTTFRIVLPLRKSPPTAQAA